MLYLNWRFTLISLSVAPVLFLVVYLFTRRIKKASRDVRKKESELVSMVAGGLLVHSRGQGFRARGLRRAAVRAPEPGKRRDGAAGARHQDAARAARRGHRGHRHLPDALVRRAAGAGRGAHRRGAGRLPALPREDVQADARPVEDDATRCRRRAWASSASARSWRPRAACATGGTPARAAPFKGTIAFNGVSFGYTARASRFSTTSALPSSPDRWRRLSARPAAARRRSSI